MTSIGAHHLAGLVARRHKDRIEPGISSQPSRNLITAAARMMVISATRIWRRSGSR